MSTPAPPKDARLEELKFFLSTKGVSDLPKNSDPTDPSKNIVWTTDPRVELPVLLYPSGKGSLMPITLIDLWRQKLPEHGHKPAISDKVNGKWQTLSYKEYYECSVRFALALIKAGVSERSSVSIVGYNCSSWLINFMGAIFANTVACGHYITNTPDAIKFVLDHADSELVTVENQEQLDKVLAILETTPKIKKVVVWNSYVLKPEHQKFADRVQSQTDFLKVEATEELMDILKRRMEVQQPGNCISYV